MKDPWVETVLCYLPPSCSTFTQGMLYSECFLKNRDTGSLGYRSAVKQQQRLDSYPRYSTRTISMSKDPVEEGIELPAFSSPDELVKECNWLAEEIQNWLDTEWDQGEPQPVHEEIGKRTAQIYSRHRMEGENDLVGILFALGSELEAMDFSKAFVGPWNVANKVSELLHDYRPELNKRGTKPDVVHWSPDAETRQEASAEHGGVTAEADPQSMPSLADKFERYKFLMELLDGSVSKRVS